MGVLTRLKVLGLMEWCRDEGCLHRGGRLWRRGWLFGRLAFAWAWDLSGDWEISIQLKVFDEWALEAKMPNPRCCERIYRLVSSVSLKSSTICALIEYHNLLDRGKGHRACSKHGCNWSGDLTLLAFLGRHDCQCSLRSAFVLNILLKMRDSRCGFCNALVCKGLAVGVELKFISVAQH